MVRSLFAIEVPNARDEQRVPLLLRPIDCVLRRPYRVADMIGAILDHLDSAGECYSSSGGSFEIKCGQLRSTIPRISGSIASIVSNCAIC